MCYVTFGLLSVSAVSKTSAFGRPLLTFTVIITFCNETPETLSVLSVIAIKQLGTLISIGSEMVNGREMVNRPVRIIRAQIAGY